MEPLHDDLQPLDAPPPPAAPTPPMHHRRSRVLAGLMIAAMAIGGVAGYTITRSVHSTATVNTASAAAAPSASATPTTKLTLAQIESKVDPALVNITAHLGGSSTAAGTGMVISSTGEILTNNHVVSGATSITVKFGATGKSYTATLVGYDVSHDIALLQIPDVSGLTTITTANASTASANDTVVALGNALGNDGAPVPAEGTVTAVEQTITASDESGGAQETLNGLIEYAAAVEPGDSGGATVNAYGQVVGMTTAAASNGYRQMSTASNSAATTAYAIPIDKALAIVRQIESGTETATVHIGQHGLLGIEAQSTTANANGIVTVVGVQSGSAAADAGIVTGDTIVSIDGTAVDTANLSALMARTHVGDKVVVAWNDSAGQAHQGTLTLTTGAA